MRRNWADVVQQVERRAQSFQSQPLSSPYKPRLSRPWQPASVWKLFPRQSGALAFAQGCMEEVHVFALEKDQSTGGQRIYLVTSYTELWHYYKTYRHSLMHCYEVIPEGAVCKLYFDLEFHKPSNRGLDGVQMVLMLIQFVCQKLDEIYGIKCSREDVLNLDSSTNDKFSRHLIFLLPNAAFKDNLHAGRFVHKIMQPALDSLQRDGMSGTVSRQEVVLDGEGFKQLSTAGNLQSNASPQAKRRKHGEEDLSFLLVKNKDGHNQLFVDLGVYTKNRNFRLYKSSKAGKNVAFSIAEDNTFVPPLDKHTSIEQGVFLASLVTNVSFKGQKILTSDPPQGAETRRLPSAPQSAARISESVGEYQHSPYKELDDFVLLLIHKDGIQGAIRRWSYFVSDQLLVYDIVKYRWCGNVGRFHQSNNIMIVVDLKQEVWYQKCHDPTCRSQNYRSPSYPLPQKICISYLLKEDDEDQEYLMDDVGNIEPSQTQEQNGYIPRSELPQVGQAEDWEEWPMDQAHLDALDKAEKTTQGEVSDELLLEMMAEYESSECTVAS
ncbi:DNA-directed primase/polymerase protein [Arapaima gigas]